MTLKDGRTYEITNKSGAKTIVIIHRGIVRTENGAHCGTVKSFTSNPNFSTLTIVEVKK